MYEKDSTITAFRHNGFGFTRLGPDHLDRLHWRLCRVL